jgi:hypothetical protein
VNRGGGGAAVTGGGVDSQPASSAGIANRPTMAAAASIRGRFASAPRPAPVGSFPVRFTACLLKSAVGKAGIVAGTGGGVKE